MMAMMVLLPMLLQPLRLMVMRHGLRGTAPGTKAPADEARVMRHGLSVVRPTLNLPHMLKCFFVQQVCEKTAKEITMSTTTDNTAADTHTVQ